MKAKIIAAVFIFSAFSVNAQRRHEWHTDSGRGKSSVYVTNLFWDNCFVGVAGGVNIYEGEFDRQASIGHHLAPALDVSVGKWFVPALGVRLQYSGLKARGMSGSGYAYATTPYRDYYKKEFNVTNLHFDVMWNCSNVISGQNEKRFWNCIPYGGFGWAYSSGNHTSNSDMGLMVGILNTFRLSDRFDFTLEARQLFVGEAFDSITGGSSKEGMTSVTMGIIMKFGKKSFQHVWK